MSDTTSPQGATPPQIISFDEIPNNVEVPGTYIETKVNYSQSGLLPYKAKALIIGQMLSSGIAKPNVAYPLYTAPQAENLFGIGSIAAQMAAAFIHANPYVAVDIMGVPDAVSAAKASQTVTIGGTATAAGTLPVYAQGQRVPVAVNVGDTAAVVAANLLAGLQGAALESSETESGAVITVTALHGGTLGNTLDLRVNYQPGDTIPAGLTVTITAMTGGATDPTITGALNAIAASWYSDIVMCWVDPTNVGLLEAALEGRYNAMSKLDAHAYGALGMSYGAGLANQASLNSRFRSVLLVQNAPQPAWMWAACFAGVCSYYLAQDPARQLRGLALPGLLAPAPADRFDWTERNLLLADGISTFDVEIDGTVTLEKVVTENLTDAAGIPTTAWHDIMAPKVNSRIKYDWISFNGVTYPRNKLADDNTIAAEYDPSVATPRRIKSSWAGRSMLYEQYGWIENSQATAAQSYFVRDLTDRNRLNCRLQYNRIGNLMVEAVSLEFQA